jgi:glycosyltransferase involved in cell wall biosynthesis
MMVEKYGLNKSIFFLGPISESQKPQLFSTSHLFILPSYSENFGLVVAEALSYGIPVITTLNTPWINLERDGCGWCIEANLNSLVNTLKLALSLDDDVLSLMGDNARSLAHSFAWSKIVPQYQLFYKSL